MGVPLEMDPNKASRICMLPMDDAASCSADAAFLGVADEFLHFVKVGLVGIIFLPASGASPSMSPARKPCSG